MELTPQMIERISNSLDAIERYTSTDTGTWARACGIMMQLAADICAMRERLDKFKGFDVLEMQVRNTVSRLDAEAQRKWEQGFTPRIEEQMSVLVGLFKANCKEMAEIRAALEKQEIARAKAGRRVRSSRPATQKKRVKKKE